jgi:nicotinamide riboside kinase
MKIAFVGAECTGKTTMSKLLAEKLSVEHIPDPYEGVVKKYGEEWAEYRWNAWGIKLKFEFEKAMHEAQFELENGKKDFVADSASLVRAACGLYLCGQDAPQKELEELVMKSLNHTFDYDVLIHLDTDAPYVDNGHRFMNKNVREGIAWMITGMLQLIDKKKIVWWSFTPNSIDNLARMHCAEKLSASK